LILRKPSPMIARIADREADPFLGIKLHCGGPVLTGDEFERGGYRKF
jgi:hypothetical protein